MHDSSAFMHYLGICGIQRRQTIGSKEISAIVHMYTLKTPKDI
jgi:hypothetical protein